MINKDRVFNYIHSVPVVGEYDVVVVGAGPAGICAAVSAARCGVRVLLAERFGSVGGMLTGGHVDPILGSVSRGTYYDEVIRRLGEQSGTPAAEEHTRNGREMPADCEGAKVALDRMIADSGATLWLGAAFADVIKDGGRVTGVIFTTQNGLVAVSAETVIDATGDGCVAAAAGARVLIGHETDGALQPMSLEFILMNVDDSCGIYVWGGTDRVLIPSGPYAGMQFRELCKQKNAEGELPKNVTIVRLHHTARPGERSVNATQANGYNPLDPASVAAAEFDLRGQIGVIVEFLRKYIPGYESCKVKSSAGVVGVRESRRIVGLDCVTDADVENGRMRSDAVVHNAWFLIDIHNPRGGGQAEGHSHMAKPYDIPLGALIPAGVDGILTAGRCISGTHRAHASYRVMAICMAMGEAAGVAAAIASESGREVRELPADEVRSVLIERGVDLGQDSGKENNE